MQRGLGVITPASVVLDGSTALASTRVIRSRSVTMPSSCVPAPTTSTLPQLARVITQAASCTLALGGRLTSSRRGIDWYTVRWVMAAPPLARGFSAARR